MSMSVNTKSSEKPTTVTAKVKSTSGNLKQYMMLLMLVIIIAMFQLLTGGKLLMPMNVSNIIFQNAYVVILAIGMLMCILSGGNIDLSVGSVVAFVCACAGTFIITWKWNPYASMLLCLGIAIVIGVWQGFWIAYVRIPAFIVTLAGMLLFRGLTLVMLNGMTLAPFPPAFLGFSTGFLPDFFSKINPFALNNATSLVVGVLLSVGFCVHQVITYANRKRKGYATDSILALALKLVIISAVLVALFYTLGRSRGIPTVLITLGILLLAYSFITSSTVMGRHLYALGGNEKAARLSGVKTKWLLFLAYVNMAFLAGVAGLVFAARLNSASPQAGQSFEMDAIAACYIGGASAYGGIGTVGGALIGALIMGVLNNGMSIMGIDSNWQQVIKGLVLLAAVAFDVISKQRLLAEPIERVKHKLGLSRAV
ncbi:MAG: sugar ABC transporter permease [Oscillospiraceae bacterium]|nr:sugar ABC transporter permease [Oscillospiraceae bacterium]